MWIDWAANWNGEWGGPKKSCIRWIWTSATWKIRLSDPVRWLWVGSLPVVATRLLSKQEAFEKCWAHSPLRAAARRLFYIAIHQVSLLSHDACASMSTTTTTTTTTTPCDRGDRYGSIEWAQLLGDNLDSYGIATLSYSIHRVYDSHDD